MAGGPGAGSRGRSSGATSCTLVSNGEITAAAPTADGTADVTVTVAGVTTPTGPADRWAEASISTPACAGIIQGFPDGTVPRAQFASRIVRAVRLTLSEATPPSPACRAWLAPAVAAGAHHRGHRPGHPRPGPGAAGGHAGHGPAGERHGALTLTDADQTHTWATAAVPAALAPGQLPSYPDGSLQPLDPASGVEAATILARS